jgi:hypothetical protein
VLRAAAIGDVGIEPIAEPLWMGHDVVALLESNRIWRSLVRDADLEFVRGGGVDHPGAPYRATHRYQLPVTIRGNGLSPKAEL